MRKHGRQADRRRAMVQAAISDTGYFLRNYRTVTMPGGTKVLVHDFTEALMELAPGEGPLAAMLRRGLI